MKIKIFFLVFVISLMCILNVNAEPDPATAEAMAQFDLIFAEIKALPDAIDNDICAKDWEAYRNNMTKLAQKIIEANQVIEGVKLVYPIDLWIIYNRISANPICGIGKRAMDSVDVADISRYSNEERLELRINDDMCACWNIITGREELTGFQKDGACRCILGVTSQSQNIGINFE